MTRFPLTRLLLAKFTEEDKLKDQDIFPYTALHRIVIEDERHMKQGIPSIYT